MLWPIKIDKVKGEEIAREGVKESGRRGERGRKRGRGFCGEKWGARPNVSSRLVFSAD